MRLFGRTQTFRQFNGIVLKRDIYYLRIKLANQYNSHFCTFSQMSRAAAVT